MISEIHRFAEENGLLIGICNPEKLFELSNRDRPFAARNVSSEDLAFAKSIIVTGLSLYKRIEGFKNDGVPRGRLSFVALGTDYHRLLTEKLQLLTDTVLHSKVFKYKIHVDTGPLPEKDLAVAAGLGFKGRNSLVVSNRFGSFFAIGLLLVDFKLEESPVEATVGCGACRRCIDACPTGALGIGGLDWNRCISYLTQAKALSSEQETLLIKKNPGNYLYGCDCCQLVCPYNRGLTEKGALESEIAYPSLYSLEGMSRKEMKERFGNTSAGWRLSCLKRNAALCLKNEKMGENRNGILEHTGSSWQHLGGDDQFNKSGVLG